MVVSVCSKIHQKTSMGQDGMRRITRDSDLSDMDWVTARKKPIVVPVTRLTKIAVVVTREGAVVGHPGDILVRGVEGEVYPIGRRIFKKTYEIIGASEQK